MKWNFHYVHNLLKLFLAINYFIFDIILIYIMPGGRPKKKTGNVGAGRPKIPNGNFLNIYKY